ncbi:hypothetical protein Tco_0694123 [Tanacetum coccineum]
MARSVGAAGYEEAQNRVRNANPGQARQIMCYNYNGICHIARNCTQPKRPQNSEYFKDKMLLMQAQDNGVALDEEQLLFIVGGQDTAVDDDMDESCYYDEANTVLWIRHSIESHNGHYQDAICDNAVLVVQSNVSSIPNDAYMIILNDIYELSAQCVSVTTQNIVVDNSLTAELVTYKEQVELYERQAKFELTEREQKINEQLRIVITNRNRKEENLKRELHSVKL